MFVVGLVGGIASGKSRVAAMFQSLGAAVIDADKLGHQALDQPRVLQRLVQLFGAGILDEKGGINRKALGALVFGPDDGMALRKEQLEQVVHPVIRSAALAQLARLRDSQPPPTAVVIDAPLLIEANWDELCDVILFVDTPLEVRQERAIARGWSRAHFDSREQSQLLLDEKRKASTHFIDGTADEQKLRGVVERLLAEMRAG